MSTPVSLRRLGPHLALFPSVGEPRPVAVGPYGELALVPDGPPAGASLPLVAVSHGSGGSPLTHRLLACGLARRGFAVVLAAHPGDDRDDRSRAGTLANLEARPRELRDAVDRALADPLLAPALAPGAVALVGHSIGGYTALALAGGRPVAAAHETGDGSPRVVRVEPDPRVRAVVLLAPALFWYRAPHALRAVRAPLLVLTGACDATTPTAHAHAALASASSFVVRRREVPDAGHYAFLSPFPEAMRRPGFAPAEDPRGFDRARFHEQLPDEVAAFLRDAIP